MSKLMTAAMMVAIALVAIVPATAQARIVAEGTAVASWYGPCCYGNSTADGTTFTESSVGVAHRTYGFNVRCTFRYGKRAATKVRVFDRGPHVKGRTFDLSAAVARQLRFSGVQGVRYTCWVPGK